MSAKASSSQPSGFGSSGALSHVYIQHPPLRSKIPGARNSFYDDGTKQLIVLTSDQVKCREGKMNSKFVLNQTWSALTF